MRKLIGTKTYDTDRSGAVGVYNGKTLYKKYHQNVFYTWDNEKGPEIVDPAEATACILVEKKETQKVSERWCTVRVSGTELDSISENAMKLGMTNRAFVMLCVEEYIRNHSQKPDS